MNRPSQVAVHVGTCLAVVMPAARLNGEDPFALQALLVGLGLGLSTFKAARLASRSMAGLCAKGMQAEMQMQCNPLLALLVARPCLHEKEK